MNGQSVPNPDFASLSGVGLALFTFLVVIVLSKIEMLSRLAVLLGLAVGTGLALFTGQASLSAVGTASPFAFPQPFAFGMPIFEVGAIISMFIVILVIMVETTADILAVGEVVGTRVDSRRVGDGLRADMASSMIAPLFNSFPASAFAQNVGLVAITGIKSRFVVSAGGVILVILGLLPVLGRVVAAIPTPVLGGAGLVLFGTVAASGIRTPAKVDYQGNMNLIIVATSVGAGLIPIAAPAFYKDFPGWFETIFHSGISSAAVMAVVLNLWFNEIKFARQKGDASTFVVADRYIDMAEIAHLRSLREGDHIEGGQVIDAEGNPVPCLDEDGNLVPYPFGKPDSGH